MIIHRLCSSGKRVVAFGACLAAAACDPSAAYDAAVEQQMEQINSDGAQLLRDIEQQVAKDAVDEYQITVRNGGSAMDRCVQAGMARAAFLQANDSEGYRQWTSVETRDCKAAGLTVQ